MTKSNNNITCAAASPSEFLSTVLSSHSVTCKYRVPILLSVSKVSLCHKQTCSLKCAVSCNSLLFFISSQWLDEMFAVCFSLTTMTTTNPNGVSSDLHKLEGVQNWGDFIKMEFYEKKILWKGYWIFQQLRSDWANRSVFLFSIVTASPLVTRHSTILSSLHWVTIWPTVIFHLLVFHLHHKNRWSQRRYILNNWRHTTGSECYRVVPYQSYHESLYNRGEVEIPDLGGIFWHRTLWLPNQTTGATASEGSLDYLTDDFLFCHIIY